MIFSKKAFLTLILLSLYTPSAVFSAFNYEDVTQKIHYKDPYIVYTSDNPLIHETKALGKSTGVRMYIFGDLNERFTQKFFKEIYPEVFTKVGDKVQFIFRHHIYAYDFQKSLATAVFSECLAVQGKFWKNIPHIINKSSSLTIGDLQEQIDLSTFGTCLKDPNTVSAIKDQSDFADKSGFIGIPTFIVENAKIENALAIKIDGVHDASFYERAVNEIIQDQIKLDEEKQAQQKIAELEKALQQERKPWYSKFFDWVKRIFNR